MKRFQRSYRLRRRVLHLIVLLLSLALLFLFVFFLQNRHSVRELRFLTPVEEAVPGRFITFVFALRNPYDEERNYTLMLDWPEGWRLIGPPPEKAPLPPGVERRIFITLGVPPQAEAGDYRVVLRAKDGDEHAAEAEARVRVAAVAIPRVEPRSPRAEAEAGHEVELIYKVRNVGNVSDAFALRVEAPEGWEVRASATTVSVKPGASATVVVQLKVPEEAPARVYQIVLEARSGRYRAQGEVKLTVLPR